MNFANIPRAALKPVAPRSERQCDVCWGTIHPDDHVVVYTKPGFTASDPKVGIAHFDCAEREEQ